MRDMWQEAERQLHPCQARGGGGEKHIPHGELSTLLCFTSEHILTGLEHRACEGRGRFLLHKNVSSRAERFDSDRQAFKQWKLDLKTAVAKRTSAAAVANAGANTMRI